MTNWRAVGMGLTTELFLGFVGLLVPGIGQLLAGLIGGLVAGYVASTSIRGGLWHGLLAGSLGGFLLAVPLGILASVVGIGVGLTELAGLVAGVGTTVLVVIAAIVLGANSALGGGMGSLMKRAVVNRRSAQREPTNRHQRARSHTGENDRGQPVSTPNRDRHDSSSGSTLVESIQDQR